MQLYKISEICFQKEEGTGAASSSTVEETTEPSTKIESSLQPVDIDESRMALLTELCSRSVDLMLNMNLLTKSQSEVLIALMQQRHPSLIAAMLQFESSEDAQQLCDTLRAFGQVIEESVSSSADSK